MRLNSWLRQDPSFPERLQVVERLSQALNEIHDRGESLAALDPDHIEVGDDGSCDVSGARRGTAAPAYSAPERAEGAGPSSEADIYAAGAIAWEVLSGRPCGPTPTHLAEASPSVPRELADAVMACLEQSPQWRPRDLTYLAQLAQHAQGQRPKAERGGRQPAASRASARSSASANVPLRSLQRRESKSLLPLAIVAGLVVAAAAGSYYWLTRTPGEAPTRPQQPSVTVATHPAGAPTPAATASAAPAAVATPVSRPTPAAAQPTPPPTPTPTPAATRPPATTLPAAALPSARIVTPETLPPRPVTLPPAPVTTLPVTTTTTTTTRPAAPPPPAVQEPVALQTISPLSVRRPGKQIFDLRGSGLRQDLRVRVLAVKDIPRGITVLRQVWKGPTLFQALVDFDASVSPGTYALVLEDAAGTLTKSLTFTVTK